MYKKILVPLDGSKLAEAVIPHVEELARGCGVKEVIIFRVCEPPAVRADFPASIKETWDEHVKKSMQTAHTQCSLYLTDIEQKLKGTGIVVKTEVFLGKPVNEITSYAEKNGVDLIVMASHGRSGVSKWVFGNTAERVLRATCVPVLMIRAPGCELPTRI